METVNISITKFFSCPTIKKWISGVPKKKGVQRVLEVPKKFMDVVKEIVFQRFLRIFKVFKGKCSGFKGIMVKEDSIKTLIAFVLKFLSSLCHVFFLQYLIHALPLS